MTFEWIDESTRIVRLRVSGELSGDDLEAVQRGMLEAIAEFGQISSLIILDSFQGWKAGEEWGDLSFQEEHDREIERIAVVGDERWRDEMLTFLLAPFRSAEVRYFADHDLARAEAWLAA